MKLKRPLPPNRSLDQIRNHYLVEKSIAQKLREGSREERKLLYARMYDDLFRQVPDHPRLTRREDEQQTLAANKLKLSLVRGFLDKSKVFIEFGSGDCRFAVDVASYAKFVFGVDISDQRSESLYVPSNFKLVLYNGYDLEEIEKNSIDIVFSFQLIEHFHPEDTKLHFKLVHGILKHGGKYIFCTPHVLTGPHDISMFFSDEPEGFHLREWSYIGIKQMLRELNYSQIHAYRNSRGVNFIMPYVLVAMCEKLLSLFPKRYIRGVAKKLMPSVFVVATK
jgi:SAM-dependent methyltransferase